ncbi:MAG: ComF family protein [Deltaproteobacteria bacterium]|nr:MAG: ComF family protein [Deltaproteobacteria bacterium]
MSSLVTSLLDVLYPPRCAACDVPLAGRAALCAACELSLYPLGPACPRCAEPLAGAVSVTCRRCTLAPPPFDRVVAPYRFGGELARAIRRFKFAGRPDLARALAPLYVPAWALAAARERIDVAVPVPLHWRRQARRGYNQAHLLAGEAARVARLPVDAVALRRVRATAPQAGLSAGERAGNVDRAFAVPDRHRRRIAGRRVLLVDDVVTTGATARAAARALVAAGAEGVVVACLARAEN